MADESEVDKLQIDPKNITDNVADNGAEKISPASIMEISSNPGNSSNSLREADSGETVKNIPHDLVLDDLYDRQNKKLIPEDDDAGNIEYKRRLDKKDKRALHTMVMQMLTRMARGHMIGSVWDAHYILGVDDDGEFSNLRKGEVINSSKILRAVVAGASAKVMSEKIYEFTTDRGVSFVMHVHIKRDFKIEHIPESTIYFMGPTGVSKTSILSNLVHDQMDNARGLSRELSLRHVHEKRSGVTSSSKFETIGSDGESIINHEISITSDVMEAICAESQILFNLVDLPGDFRYSKTICHSLLTLAPELILICIPILDPISYIQEHQSEYMTIFQVCSMFKIQPLLVFAKTDLIPSESHSSVMSETVQYLIPIFRDLGIETRDIDSIRVNNVESDGIEELNEYLVNFGNSILESLDSLDDYDEDCDHDQMLYKVHDVFDIPDIGTVIHGVLIRGSFNTSDRVRVICHGKVMERKILSIHRKAMDVERLNEGETGSIMISGRCDRSIIDKTSVITNSDGLKYLSSTGLITSVTGESIRPKQYVMFVGNNIITILVKETDTPNVYSFMTHNSTCILIDVVDGFAVPGILRDENKILTFIRVMPTDVSEEVLTDDSSPSNTVIDNLLESDDREIEDSNNSSESSGIF